MTGQFNPEALARDILQGLAEGRFSAGQRLSERELMERYEVGRSTVREALNRLSVAGVAQLIPHRGAAIRRMSRLEAENTLRLAASLLSLLARQAAEAAARGADTAELQVAYATLSTQRGGARLGARAFYYRALTGLAGNAEVARLLPQIQVPLLRAQLGTALAFSPQGQAPVVAAIVAGNPEAAAKAAEEHVSYPLASLAQLSEGLFAPASREAHA